MKILNKIREFLSIKQPPPFYEENGILGKSTIDPYTYYAYIRDFGWIRFHHSELLAGNRLLLNNPEFLTWLNSTEIVDLSSIVGSAKDRGLEIRIEDLVILIDSWS